MARIDSSSSQFGYSVAQHDVPLSISSHPEFRKIPEETNDSLISECFQKMMCHATLSRKQLVELTNRVDFDLYRLLSKLKERIGERCELYDEELLVEMEKAERLFSIRKRLVELVVSLSVDV